MEQNYVISVRTKKGRVVAEGESCHPLKSLAGVLIQSPSVKSVYVGDIKGTAMFYMRKDDEGHVIPEKTINVSSKLALFG
jgi:hypothetical protein